MNIGHYCKARREYIGLSREDVAKRIAGGFEVSLLYDFEGGDESDIDGWSMEVLCTYLRILKMSVVELADIPMKGVPTATLGETIRARREESGFSPEELDDHIGYA